MVFKLAYFWTEVLLFDAETDRVEFPSVFFSIPFVEMGYVLSQRGRVHARGKVEDARNEEDRPEEVTPDVDRLVVDRKQGFNGVPRCVVEPVASCDELVNADIIRRLVNRTDARPFRTRVTVRRALRVCRLWMAALF